MMFSPNIDFSNKKDIVHLILMKNWLLSSMTANLYPFTVAGVEQAFNVMITQKALRITLSSWNDKSAVIIKDYLKLISLSKNEVGFQKFNELAVKVYVVMGTLICGCVFIIYFAELDLMYEGLCYTVLVFTAFLMFMDLVGCSYLIIKAGTKKTDDTIEAIGLIIGNSLVISRGVGNVFSILIHEYFPR